MVLVSTEVPIALCCQSPACVFKLGQTVLHVFFLQPSMKSPPAHLHRVHPSSHSAEGGGVSYVIHGEDAVSFTVVLLSDAAKPEQTSVKGVRKRQHAEKAKLSCQVVRNKT